MTDSSSESRDFSPARYRQGCENVLDRREAGRRTTPLRPRRVVRGEEGKTTFTTTRSATRITAGVGLTRCHEDSVGFERGGDYSKGKSRVAQG